MYGRLPKYKMQTSRDPARSVNATVKVSEVYVDSQWPQSTASPTPIMVATSLTDLAPELKRAIFCSDNVCHVVHETRERYSLQQLQRLTDLYNLCLVCKDLYLHASPVLYETVTLDRGKLRKPGYTSGVVSHATGGRSPVRHLAFRGYEHCSEETSIVPLLEAFPRDSLYSVRYVPQLQLWIRKAILIQLVALTTVTTSRYLHSNYSSAAKGNSDTYDFRQYKALS